VTSRWTKVARGTALHDMSIRRKQVAIIMLTSTVALLLACISFMVYDARSFRRDMTERLSSLAVVIGNNLAAAIDFDDPAAAGETLAAVRGEPSIIHAHVRRADGSEFASYLRDDAPQPAELATRESQEVFIGDRLHVYRPIMVRGESVGTIELVATLHELRERLVRYASIAGVVLTASLLVTYLLSAVLQRLISAPILELARVARQVATDKNYRLRVERASRDEIGQLVDGFNEMLSQIQSRDDALQAAHELLERRVVERTAALQHAQEETAREQAKFRFIFESVPVGISWFVPGEEQTHLVNPAHERITGVSAEEARRPGAFALVSHPDDYARQKVLTEQFVRGDIEQYSLEKRYLHPDDRVIWAVLTSRMFTDPATGRKQSVTTLVDITELKRSEAKLAYEHGLLRALLDTSPDSIYFKDRESRILRCSASMARAVHLPSTELLVGKSDFELFGADLARESSADELEIMRTGAPIINKTERAVLPDGQVVWTLTSKMPLRDERGEIIGTMGISKDITGIKEAEAKLDTAHKELVHASRMAGMAEVATGVLHNVGNVLNSVNVAATLATEHVRGSQSVHLARVCALLRSRAHDIGEFITHDPKGRQVPAFLEQLAQQLAAEQTEILGELDVLRKNIEHIKEIVALQQNYTKVSGVAEIVEVTELVEDALRMNLGALDRHEVRLVREYQARGPIATERHKVLQILVNLIRNAKYACDANPREGRRVIVRLSVDDHFVRIAVIDNGIGIPAENLTRIFSHGFTTRKDGHGFGLHSGALAARELDGTLTAHSEGVGRGATFVLELPANAPGSAVVAAVAEASAEPNENAEAVRVAGS
jgi:PAS domain S-box-containing protein